jgi:hypothetical protein
MNHEATTKPDAILREHRQHGAQDTTKTNKTTTHKI